MVVYSHKFAKPRLPFFFWRDPNPIPPIQSNPIQPTKGFFEFQASPQIPFQPKGSLNSLSNPPRITKIFPQLQMWLPPSPFQTQFKPPTTGLPECQASRTKGFPPTRVPFVSFLPAASAMEMAEPVPGRPVPGRKLPEAPPRERFAVPQPRGRPIAFPVQLPSGTTTTLKLKTHEHSSHMGPHGRF